MTTKALLIAARARIAEPEHWTQGSYAKNKYDEDTHYCSLDARRWCAAGALLAEPASMGAFAHARHLLSDLAGHSLSYVNDTCAHADVVRLFDKAIEACV